MRKKIYKITTALSIGFVFTIVSAYQAFAQDRMDMIESQLTELADSLAPGLNEKVNVSVSGVSLEEFIRALARSNNLNVDVDASLDQELINNFSDETVANILLFLCRQYDLDITFMGSILSIVPYAAPLPARQRYTPKNINVSYNKNEDLLSLDLRNDSLYLVVKKITQEVGKNIILSPEIGNQLVNVFIVELSLTEALTNFTYANALSVNQISDEVYIIEKGKLDGNSAGQSQSRNKNRNKNGENVFSVIVDNDASGNRVLTVDAFNIPIVDLIEFVSKEMYIDYFLFSDIKGTSTMSVSNLTYDNFLSYLLQGTDYTYKKQDHIYLIGHRNLEGLRHSKLLQLQYRSAEKIVELIPKEIKKGVQLQTFLELNSIILSGSKPQIDEIELFVRELDQLVPVILIDVIVVDVNKNRITSLGITAGVNNSIVTGGTIYPGVDFNIGSSTINNLIAILSGNGLWNLGNVTPDFYINLKALETDGIVNLRSTPKLATLNGHTASMSIGETDYY
ncbi:MAG: general secretion pathway protein GspD [Bacteroidetes bacterium]|nr:general secretion pathway protein GspD [Bacteroidota bacterium]